MLGFDLIKVQGWREVRAIDMRAIPKLPRVTETIDVGVMRGAEMFRDG
jgi:hypothetical protein